MGGNDWLCPVRQNSPLLGKPANEAEDWPSHNREELSSCWQLCQWSSLVLFTYTPLNFGIVWAGHQLSCVLSPKNVSVPLSLSLSVLSKLQLPRNEKLGPAKAAPMASKKVLYIFRYDLMNSLLWKNVTN